MIKTFSSGSTSILTAFPEFSEVDLLHNLG